MPIRNFGNPKWTFYATDFVFRNDKFRNMGLLELDFKYDLEVNNWENFIIITIKKELSRVKNGLTSPLNCLKNELGF